MNTVMSSFTKSFVLFQSACVCRQQLKLKPAFSDNSGLKSVFVTD